MPGGARCAAALSSHPMSDRVRAHLPVWIQQVIDWVRDHPAIVWSAFGVSVALFVGTLIAVPWLVGRIPVDYFSQRRRRRVPRAERRHPPLRLLALVAKNLVGVALVACGALMLFVPGQGLVTIVVGVMLMDFPGKFKLERWLVGRRPVLGAINWLRARSGRPPLEVRRGRK